MVNKRIEFYSKWFLISLLCMIVVFTLAWLGSFVFSTLPNDYIYKTQFGWGVNIIILILLVTAMMTLFFGVKGLTVISGLSRNESVSIVSSLGRKRLEKSRYAYAVLLFLAVVFFVEFLFIGNITYSIAVLFIVLISFLKIFEYTRLLMVK